MRCTIILSVLSLIPQIVAGGLFDILEERYITDISELPYSPGSPTEAWQPSMEYFKEHCKRDYSPYFISGNLDIVGFRNSVKNEGKLYINESAADAAIIRYETNVCALGYPRYKGGWDYKLETYEQDNQLVAKLTATAILYYYIESHKHYDNITGVFYDSELLPLQYNTVFNPSVNVTEYYNSIEQKIAITVIEPNAAKIVIRYSNNTVMQRLKSYHVEQTDKGVYYANVSTLEAWTIEGQGVGRFGNSVLINTNLSAFDYSKLDIEVSDIYNTVKASNYSIIRTTFDPDKIVYNSLLFGFLGTFITLTGAAGYLFRRAIP